MVWQVKDPRSADPCVLVMPRQALPNDDDVSRWQAQFGRVRRLEHPAIARVLDGGCHQRWPYLLYASPAEGSLADVLARTRVEVPDLAAAQCLSNLADALNTAHRAAFRHGDLQPFLVAWGGMGTSRLMGIGLLLESGSVGEAAQQVSESSSSARRWEARQDLVALGVIFHQVLTRAPVLDEMDVGRVVARVSPMGREWIRIPTASGRPLPEALRVIANRATDRREDARYPSAQALFNALQGWIKSTSSGDAGPLALIMGRLGRFGLLPAQADVLARLRQAMSVEGTHANVLSDVLLEDPGLVVETLRAVNISMGAASRTGVVAGSVLGLRRSVVMLGMEGLRDLMRTVKIWPMDLGESAAEHFLEVQGRIQAAMHVALALRPPGYDEEVVRVVTLMQGLGRLILAYHLPEASSHLQGLIQSWRTLPPGPADARAQAPSEEQASLGILGVTVDDLGSAVARYCGLDEPTVRILRRLPMSAPVHATQDDDELLRMTASCAHESLDALSLSPNQALTVLGQIQTRYGRILKFSARQLRQLLSGFGVSEELDRLWSRKLGEPGMTTFDDLI